MSEDWLYQLRINLADDVAELARTDPANPAIRPLADILARHQAAIKCQYDAFADYVAEAEKNGIEQYPLYKWTKVTIEDPVKKAKYVKAFAVYVEGDEVYPKAAADAIEADLQKLVGGPIVTRLAKHDSNPANNPQPPAHLRS